MSYTAAGDRLMRCGVVTFNVSGFLSASETVTQLKIAISREITVKSVRRFSGRPDLSVQTQTGRVIPWKDRA